MTHSSKDTPDKPIRISSRDDVDTKTMVSRTPTEFISEELEETAITPRSGTQRIKAPAPRRYLLGIATDMGPRMLALASEQASIGRMESNDLCLQHGSVSRRHAVLEVTNRGVAIKDLGSQNGTSINGNAAVGLSYLKPGDIVRVGYVAIFYFGFMSPDDPPQIEMVNHPVVIVPLAPDPNQ